ncbi:hypothetical protein EDD99_3496 [Streptomyces sp. 846.5]|nr:hypothetical protein [Streptomyces sp. 846.5]TDU05011.1 hypothetical protein EDD99_3496 [Streptomyces sp. 846.5]
MRIRTRRGAVLAAATGLLALLPGGLAVAQTRTVHATAKPLPVVGTLQVGCNGFPRTVKRGSTINVTMWYRQVSPDELTPTDFGLLLWSSKSGTPGAPQRGVSVSWQDPQTGRWVASNGSYSPGDFEYYPAGVQQWPSGYWAHQYVRITFAGTADLGGWNIQCAPAATYALQTHSGAYVLGVLHLIGGSFPIYRPTLQR